MTGVIVAWKQVHEEKKMNKENLEMRPFPNEHSCRLKPPNYPKYARKNCYKKHDGKCIDYIFGVISADESELQAMRYPKDIWTEEAARAHCKEADGAFEPAKEEEKNMEQVERRIISFAGAMRALTGEDGAMIIEGYPIIYEVYAPLWGFREIIRKGAATEALKNADELVLWDHESSQPMARRSAGTLEAIEDEKGVFIRADVSKTIWGRNGYEAIQNEIINRMSFAFDVEEDKWSWEGEDDSRIETREILSFANLYDYSPVSYPAYKETVVMARCRDLALRHRPEPGAPGDGGRALLEAPRLYRTVLDQDQPV